MRKIILGLFLLTIALSGHSQDYDPLDFTGNLENPEPGTWTYHYSVKDHLGSLLAVSGKDVAIFVNNQLLSVSDSDSLELDRLGSGEIRLTFSSQGPISAQLLRPVKTLQGNITSALRANHGLYSYISLFVTLMLIFLSMVRWNQGREFNDYIRISRMFSPRNSDENILRAKLMTSSNLQFVLLLDLVVSGSVVIYLNLQDGTLKTFGLLAWEWLSYFGIFGVFLLVKWILINTMATIFNFNEFYQIHVVNYLRISAFFAVLWTIILLGYAWWSPGLFSASVFYWAVAISALFRMLVLFLKLNNTESYRTFHLFSYLCATELIPFFGVFYFTSRFF